MFSFQVVYGFTLCVLKTSILLFYIRIFGGSRTFRLAAYSIVVITVAVRNKFGSGVYFY
jgi:hypothetical protein